MKKFNINNIYKYDLIIFLLILFIFSSFSFYKTEPGIDQIRHISWIESLVNSKYLLNLELIKEKGLIYELLQFSISNPAVTAAIPGAKTVKQLNENIQAAYIPQLTMEELDKIDKITKPGGGRKIWPA